MRVPLGGPYERGVLAALLLNAGRVVTVRQLVDAVWDDDPPATAAKQVQNIVSRLRGALERAGAPGVIVTVTGGYQLGLDQCVVDARAFEEGIAAAERSAAEGRTGEAAGLLREALALWRGPALAGLAGRVLESSAAALDERRVTAQELYYAHELALGRHREVLGELAGLAAGSPFRERLAGLYMLALYRCGRQADALAVYRATRELLAGQLGLDPGPELRGLHQQILAADPALAPPAGTAVRRAYSADGRTWTDGVAPPPLANASGVVESPYRGLAAFEEQDTAFFFGRDQAVADVLGRMAGLATGGGLLVVSGVSGAGKSSLLRAGVLPRLRTSGLAGMPGSGRWPCVVLTPGRAPLDELAVRVASLAGVDAAGVRRGLDADPSGFALTARQAAMVGQPGPGGPDGPDATATATVSAATESPARLLLVVDQFEQVLTRCPDDRERRAFVAALHAAATACGPQGAQAALVVLVVRADFEAQCAGYEELAQAVQDRYLVTPMTMRQLELAITEPARLAGATVDDRLVRTLLDQARTRQGDAAGAGVLPLVSHALDQAWRHRAGTTLTLADYERAGGIEGAVAASAQRAYDQLTPAQQGAARLVFTRLTATTSDGIDVAARATLAELTSGMPADGQQDVHEVLDAFVTERLLTVGADNAEISHEALLTAWPLLRDTWLAQTHADRIVRTKLAAATTEWDHQRRDSSYLYSGNMLQAAASTASRITADPVRHPALTTAERDFLTASHRAQHRATRLRRTGIAVLAALAVGLAATTALVVRADRQATYQRNAAAAEELASESRAVGNANPVLARLLAVAAWRLSPSALVARQVWPSMLSAAALSGIRNLSSGLVTSMAFSPDGKLLASVSIKGKVRLWHVATGQPAGAPLTTTHVGEVSSVAFSPDGKLLAGGGFAGKVQLWHVATGQPAGAPLTTSHSEVNSVAFSPDGTTLASGSEDGTIRLWHVAAGQPAGPPITATGHPYPVISVAFSPDGKLLAGGSLGGKVRLWHVATGQPAGVLHTANYAGPVYSVAFSPDGTTLASGSHDGTIHLWHMATGQQITALRTGSHNGLVSSVAFSPDGTTLASSGDDGAIHLWNVATGQQTGTLRTGSHNGPVNSVTFSPDGTTLASTEAYGPVHLWRVATGQQIGAPLTTSHNGAGHSVAFSPDGKLLASGSQDGTIHLWLVATGQQIGAPLTTSHAGSVNSVAFSPDGKLLASGSQDGTIHLWRIATGQQIGAPLTASRGGGVDSVAFSPDGKLLASGALDGTVRLWNVATGQQIATLRTKSHNGLPDPIVSVAFSPDGATLATGGDGILRLWKVATGQPAGAPFPVNPGTWVNSMAFSPDGKLLASGGDDIGVRLWHVATGQPAGLLTTTPGNMAWSVAFSPNGTTLAAGLDDGTIWLWNVATSLPAGSFASSHPGPVQSVAFSPGSTILASLGDDGQVRRWNVSYVTDTAAYLCAVAGRSLTRAEWAQYAPPGLAYQAVCP